MTWNTYRCLQDTLAVQLAELVWELLDALGDGRITDTSDSTDPMEPDEIAAAVTASSTHLVSAGALLGNLAVQPRRANP